MRVVLRRSTPYVTRGLVAVFVALCVAFCATGCASTGDLHSLVEANRQFEASVAKSLAELKAGSIPVAEFEERVTQRCSELRGEVVKVRQHAERRVEEVASSALSKVDVAGLSLIVTGLIAGALDYFQGRRRNRSRATDPRISNDYVRVQRQGASFDESS